MFKENYLSIKLPALILWESINLFIFIFRQQMKKVIKAKDCYGPVLERVKQNNIAKVQQENDIADPPPPGGNIMHTHNRAENKNY